MTVMESVHPLVRYVDESQAVVDVVVAAPAAQPTDATLRVRITGEDGFEDESHVAWPAGADRAQVRLDLVHPDRWWPACMGEQPLYELTAQLLVGDLCIDERTTTLGLTSVRAGEPSGSLLVNGQVCDIRSVVMVDRIDERQLLPATGDSLLLVRDHYGPDVLYQAADRAGILLIQCVPIHVEATPEVELATQISRLVGHPSLAGWFVGHLGHIADAVATHIAAADPTRAIFRVLPDAA